MGDPLRVRIATLLGFAILHSPDPSPALRVRIGNRQLEIGNLSLMRSVKDWESTDGP